MTQYVECRERSESFRHYRRRAFSDQRERLSGRRISPVSGDLLPMPSCNSSLREKGLLPLHQASIVASCKFANCLLPTTTQKNNEQQGGVTGVRQCSSHFLRGMTVNEASVIPDLLGPSICDLLPATRGLRPVGLRSGVGQVRSRREDGR